MATLEKMVGGKDAAKKKMMAVLSFQLTPVKKH